MKTLGMILALMLGLTVHAAAQHPYADSARSQARRLLAFHFGEDSRASVADEVKQLKSIRNPAGGTRKLEVLEVWGYVYKGEYRIRLYYAKLDDEYVLMGQEIVEFARL